MSHALGAAVFTAMLGAIALGSLFRPSVAVAGVVCIFGLKQWSLIAHPWFAQHPLFANYGVAVIVVVALLVQMSRDRCVLCRLPGIHLTIVALYAYAFLSLTWTPDPASAWPVWDHNYPYIATAILLAPLLIKGVDDLRTTLIWVTWLGGLLLALLLMFGPWGVRGLLVDAGGYFGETNPLALAGLGGAVASAAMFVRFRRLRLLARCAQFVIVAIGLVVIVRSGSRGQLAAAVLSIMLMMPVGLRVNRLGDLTTVAAGIAVVVVAVVYGVSEYVHWFDARWSETTARADIEGRLAMAEALLRTWADSGLMVIFGLGNSAAFSDDIAGFYPHNVPLEVLGEEGLVGFAIYLAAMLQAALALLSARRGTRLDPQARGVVAAAGASFAFFFVLSLKEGNMVGSVFLFMYAILIGSLARSLRTTTSATNQDPVRMQPLPFPNLLR